MVARGQQAPTVKTYSLDDVVAAVNALRDDMVALAGTVGASERQKSALRNKAAVAVSRAYLAGFGQKMFAAIVADTLPDSPRRTVNISESWRVIREHPKARDIAVVWARGEFEAVKVSDALKDVRPVRSTLDALRAAVRRALEDGQIVSDIHDAVDAVVAEVEAEERAEAEEENEGTEDSERGTQQATA